MKRSIDENALFNLAYGMYIVTSALDGKRNGQIVTAAFQVTAEPPCVVACIHKDNLTHEYISRSDRFAISVLDQETPMTMIGTFGFKSGRDIDKFAEVNYGTGETGCPVILDHTLAVVEAEVLQQVDVGTHTLFVAEVVAAKVLREGVPFTYSHYREVKKGKTPENAPTFHPTS